MSRKHKLKVSVLAAMLFPLDNMKCFTLETNLITR